MKIIAHIHNDFPTKFGVPRQSGLVPQAQSVIVFEPEYRVAEALRGMEGYSHLWLIWEFHQAKREAWSPTVRPPRLGGNTRMGVFATRSPFRPNPIGLSCVKLETIKKDEKLGTVLWVSGADLMDGTPIYDIKPYLPYADCRPEATGGFAHEVLSHALDVSFPEEFLALVPPSQQKALMAVLSQDPRPGYQHDPNRMYGFPFGDLEIRFKVEENHLTVCQVEKIR
ncbi:MAG: tRNA (N6-threonylcarbamoyladenosine(37)-N6)-methyltransferase TrmO [Clostridiales bacterium]|nr:tRNA (N6-threonylcarbamoyladenosine(37)-N6)-methyltransferase TrmO [Clostridiales bacterium]